MDEFSSVVNDDVSRIERLIHEILGYARYMEPKLAEENINEIIMSCILFLEVKAERQGITHYARPGGQPATSAAGSPTDQTGITELISECHGCNHRELTAT